jgi:23S rRNA pseudouridine1911/1915/1917 synthase
MKINILYEDNHLLVVEKPINVPVQEDSSKDKDLLTMLKEYIKEEYNKPGNVYLGLVHRLDRPVGGVMVFARTSKAASRLSDSIRKKEIKKTYLAIVHGKTKNKEKLVDYISKDEKTNTTYLDKNGKEAILTYETLYYDERNDRSLVKVNLETGRHHQIRFQLSNIGHPIVGDNRYGKMEHENIKLFSYSLEFIHPVTKEKMTFKELPKWSIIESVKELL